MTSISSPCILSRCHHWYRLAARLRYLAFLWRQRDVLMHNITSRICSAVGTVGIRCYTGCFKTACFERKKKKKSESENESVPARRRGLVCGDDGAVRCTPFHSPDSVSKSL